MAEVVYRCRCGAKQVFPEGERAECAVCGLFLDPAHDLAAPGWEPSPAPQPHGLRSNGLRESPEQLSLLLAVLLVVGFALGLGALGQVGLSWKDYLGGWGAVTLLNFVVTVAATRAIGVRLGHWALACLKIGVQVQISAIGFSLAFLAVGSGDLWYAVVPLLCVQPACYVALFGWNWLGSGMLSIVQTGAALWLLSALSGGLALLPG